MFLRIRKKPLPQDLLVLSLKSNYIVARGLPRGLRLVGGLCVMGGLHLMGDLWRDPALGWRVAVQLVSGPVGWADGRGAPEGGPTACFLRWALHPWWPETYPMWPFQG